MQFMRTEGKKMASAQPTGHYVSLILCCTFNLIRPLTACMASSHIFLLRWRPIQWSGVKVTVYEWLTVIRWLWFGLASESEWKGNSADANWALEHFFGVCIASSVHERGIENFEIGEQTWHVVEGLCTCNFREFVQSPKCLDEAM